MNGTWMSMAVSLIFFTDHDGSNGVAAWMTPQCTLRGIRTTSKS
jgi:hypothetical protein